MEKRANKTKEHKNAFDVLVGAVFRVICAPKKKKKWRHAYCCSLNNGTTISLVPTLKKHIYLVLVLSLLMEAHHIISSTTNIKKEKALTDWPSSPPCQFFSGGSYVLLLTATGSVTCRTLTNIFEPF